MYKLLFALNLRLELLLLCRSAACRCFSLRTVTAVITVYSSNNPISNSHIIKPAHHDFVMLCFPVNQVNKCMVPLFLASSSCFDVVNFCHSFAITGNCFSHRLWLGFVKSSRKVRRGFLWLCFLFSLFVMMVREVIDVTRASQSKVYLYFRCFYMALYYNKVYYLTIIRKARLSL